MPEIYLDSMSPHVSSSNNSFWESPVIIPKKQTKQNKINENTKMQKLSQVIKSGFKSSMLYSIA